MKLTDKQLTMFFVFFLLLLISGIGIVCAIPNWDFFRHPGMTAPGIWSTVGVGIALSALTFIFFALGLKVTGYLKIKLLFFAAGYNICIAFAKFVFAPQSLYIVNTGRGFEAGSLFDIFSGTSFSVTGILSTAIATFFLYFLVYITLTSLARQSFFQHVPKTISKSSVSDAMKVLTFFIFVIGVTFLLLSPLFELEYVSIVLSTGAGFMAAVFLLIAVFLAGFAFHEAKEQAIALRDIGVITTLFWIGLSFLIVFQVLWIVYFMVITSLWPLRTYAAGK